MKVLVYIGSHDNNSINAVDKRLKMGDDVVIVSCDHSLGICRDNFYGNQLFCKFCSQSNDHLWKTDFEERGAQVLKLSEIVTAEDKEEAKNASFLYDSISSLKNVTYKGVEIGFGAFSTYVSVTRNVMPDMTAEFKKYINFLMKKEMATINAIDRVITQFHPDLIILHNGRFAEFKPILGLAQNKGINYMTTEEVYFNGKVLENNFDNDVVHSITANYQKYLDNWIAGKESEEEKIKIGKSFFEKRRKSIAAGDTVYTLDQVKGLLPEGFNRDKEVISIFNSSEDEFCAVSKDYDSYKLFENQYIGLKAIFDHYKDDKSKHFYLRIHPHLKNVPYRSHTKLYELNYDNVTIISPSSPVDSYVLMDNSEKIVVFDSTMAVESAYWGKPVIELSKYVWSLMDVVYTPATTDELWQLIDSKDLKCKYNDNCLKYAYWVLKPNYEEETYLNYQDVDVSFFGRKYHQDHQFLKICGSSKLYTMMRLLLTRRNVMRILKPITSFSSLPCSVNH